MKKIRCQTMNKEEGGGDLRSKLVTAGNIGLECTR